MASYEPVSLISSANRMSIDLILEPLWVAIHKHVPQSFQLASGGAPGGAPARSAMPTLADRARKCRVAWSRDDDIEIDEPTPPGIVRAPGLQDPI